MSTIGVVDEELLLSAFAVCRSLISLVVVRMLGFPGAYEEGDDVAETLPAMRGGKTL